MLPTFIAHVQNVTRDVCKKEKEMKLEEGKIYTFDSNYCTYVQKYSYTKVLNVDSTFANQNFVYNLEDALDYGWKIEPASAQQIRHYEICEKAGKYIPYEEPTIKVKYGDLKRDNTVYHCEFEDGDTYLYRFNDKDGRKDIICLLYTSPSPRDRQKSRMPSSA